MAPTVRQGPKAGRRWGAAIESYTDPHTGARVRRLSRPGAEDRHLYFTADGWYDDGRRLLLRSRREGRSNLYSLDTATEEITRLTDLEHGVYGCTRVNDATDEVYFAYDPEGSTYDNDRILGLNVETLAVREVARKPDGYDGYGFGVDDVLADDERLLVSVSEHIDAEGHEARRAEYPHCAVFAADIEGDGVELLHDEEYWISHVNASPTRPEMFTYCHEGPWHEVDNRIHLCNIETGEDYQLRSVEGTDEAVGHEYWLADGETVGYHGWRGDLDRTDCFHGFVRYDDTDRTEVEIPVRRTHCHANTRERFVCDGDDTAVPFVLLYEYDEGDDAYRGPRALATHAWDADSPHPHSRFSPDGTTVVFDSDPTGDGDVFLVDVPDFETLPEYDPDD
jgi:oligogalacturonide lyase